MDRENTTVESIPSYTEVEDMSTAFVLFTPSAFVKMTMLVNACDTELAWHGVVEKLKENVFCVTDILVFPQYVSGGRTITEDREYWGWVFSKPNDMSLNLHGHSHVNMMTFRSGTDQAYQDKLIASLRNDDAFYIFIIANKRGDYNIRIYNRAVDKIWDSDKGEAFIDISGMNEYVNESFKMLRPISDYVGPTENIIDEFGEDEDVVPVSSSYECEDGYDYDFDYDDDWLHMEKFSAQDPFARNDL